MFVTYQVSLDLIRSLRDLVPVIQKHDRDLADQMHRAATSVSLNLAEGQRLRAGNQRRHYEIAHGSANEVRAAIDVAAAWGWIKDATEQRKVVDRLLALLWAHAGSVRRDTQGRTGSQKPDVRVGGLSSTS